MTFSPLMMMAAGPVEYKRKYELWVLILLVLVCWPVALIYYFTREKVPVQTFQSYSMNTQGQPAYSGQPMGVGYPQATAPTGSAPNCPRCGKPGTWIAQYSRWYCNTDQQYL